MFQIWVNAAKNAYMLINNLTPEDAKALEGEGCRKVQDLKALQNAEAQKEFIEFCEHHDESSTRVLPANTVEFTDRLTLIGIARKKL